jgi:predicted PurR-regulated permease PerM
MNQASPPPGGGIAGTIERGLALIVVGAVVIGIFATLRPFAIAILFGSILAIALWPLRAMLLAAGLRRPLAAGLLLALVIAAIVLPLLILAPGLVAAIQGGAHFLIAMVEKAPTRPPAWLTELPLVGDRGGAFWAGVVEARGNLGPLLTPYAARLQSILLDVATGLADSGIQMLLALVVATMLWTSGDAIAEVLNDGAQRIGGATGHNALHAAVAAVRAVAYGVVGTSAAQGVLAGIGFAIAGVPAAPLLGFLTLIFSISQILGPMVVVLWGGAAWWLVEQEEPNWAFFMAVWGLLVVSGSDNVLRPLLIRRGVEMPMSLIVLGVFGGFVAFGFLGLFIGPTLLAVGLVMLRAWRAPPASG